MEKKKTQAYSPSGGGIPKKGTSLNISNPEASETVHVQVKKKEKKRKEKVHRVSTKNLPDLELCDSS